MRKTAALIRAEAERIMALGESSPRIARDPVNLPIIENWVEAIGDTNPVYTDAGFAAASAHGGLVAPPAMTQVWTMAGQRRSADASDPTSQMVAVLEEAGYTSVVATNSDHVFRRYVRLGERLSLRVSLADLIGPKQTALGEGWFFTTRNTWYSGGEIVATMDFRILKFRPPAAGDGREASTDPQAKMPPATPPSATPPDAGAVIRPVVSPDTRFFWDGMLARELRIQRCCECGTLRHPPGPMCPECGGFRGVDPPGRQGGG
ncbi:MAG TPA: MaoC family dehydratase N-terminal domain-containing protein, partial [Streptosporangiaceae bacterium]